MRCNYSYNVSTVRGTLSGPHIINLLFMRAMRAVKCCLILLSTVLAMLPAPVRAQGGHQSVGLVLSGGGAKGIAHIGLIKALEDNDIPIDYITGTSMGAIVGGLYACGYTPEEMMQLINSEYFSYMAAGKTDPGLSYYFARQAPSPQMFSMSPGRRDSTARDIFNPQSLISPMPMNFGFMQIFAAYTARCGGDYDRLFVPFRCVASDVIAKRKKVMGSGRLEESIRASMSFPLVFQAIQIDSVTLYDGGVYDNFPVDVMMTEFAPSILIGADVSAPSEGPANSYFDQLDLLMSRQQSYDVPPEAGIKVRIDVSRFGLLDWDKAPEIYRAGYDKGMAMIDSIKSRVHVRSSRESRRLRRAVFKSTVPELRFDSVEVSGGSRRQNEYIKYLFRSSKGADTIGVDHARLSFYRALSSGQMDILRVGARCTDSERGLFTLSVDARAKSSLSAGAGAYITSTNNSYLYLRCGYSSLSFSSAGTDLEAWIGQSYMAAMLSGRLTIASGIPSAFTYAAVVSRRKYYENEELFFRDNEPTFVTAHEYYAKLGWTIAAGRRGMFETGVGAGKLRSAYYAWHTPEIDGRSRVDHVLGQVYAGYESSTLNGFNYPTAGGSLKVKAAGVLGKVKCTQPGFDGTARKAWAQLDVTQINYFGLHRHWALGVESRALISSRGLLGAYEACISSAPSYTPTPSSDNSFNPALRANSFIAAGVVPVYKYNSSLSARLAAHAFMPLRSICALPDGGARYGAWLGSAKFFGELDVVYTLPFGDVAAYCNYTSSPGRFNAGISFGIYLPAPKFL